MSAADEETAQTIATALDDARVTKGPGTEGMRVHGRRAGVALVVRCRRSSKTSVWSVEAKGSAKPLVLATAYRRQIGDAAPIASGAFERVPTGDEGFDREWLVEGAPRATASAVFDEQVRLTLGAAGDMTLTIDRGVVTAAMNGVKFDTEDVELGIKAVVAVRARLEALADAAPSADDAAGEIERLRAKQDQWWARAAWPARILITVFVVVLVLALFSGVYYGCGINVLFEK